MKHVTCSRLIVHCDAVFEGATANDIVLQYVIHASFMHRKEAILVEDLLDAITETDHGRARTEQQEAI